MVTISRLKNGENYARIAMKNSGAGNEENIMVNHSSSSKRKFYRRAVLFGVSLTIATLCTGCGVGTKATQTSPSVTTMHLQGIVHGGQNPVNGASIYLMSFGSSGYGSAGTSQLDISGANVLTDASNNGYVTTDSTGHFDITGDYSGCSDSTPIYLLALQGDSGFGGNNSAIALMAALGTCAQVRAMTFISVNEITTVAAAYALAQFANVTTDTFGTSSGNSLGLTNAIATANNLVDLPSGQTIPSLTLGSGTHAATLTVPQKEIYTIANALGVCVNSSGKTSTGCSELFADTYPAASNTLQAAIYLAQNPTLGLGTGNASLVNIQAGMPAFLPNLSSNPTDWTIGLVLSGGGINDSRDAAVDGSGNIWFANYNSTNSVNTLSEISPNGAPISPSTGFTGIGLSGAAGLAIDATSSTVWVANSASSTVAAILTSTDAPITGSPFGGGNINTPAAVAIDPSGNIWTANGGSSSVSKFSNSGSILSGTSANSTACTGSLNNPSGVAIDHSGNAWVASRNNNNLVAFSTCTTTGPTLLPNSPFTNSMNGPVRVAIDRTGNVWVPSLTGSTLSGFTSSGSPLSNSPFSGGGISGPFGVAVDGDSHVWITNYNGNSISEYTNAGVAISSSNGYAKNLVSGATPHGLAIDQSGNVWIAYSGSGVAGEIVGSAAPVVAPLALATKNNTLGTRP